MHVIVETARGVEMGTVLIAPKEVEDDQVVQPLKPVIRVATDEDEKVMERNKEKEVEAFAICKDKIAKHGLEMKLVAAEYTFDNNKLLFYFIADGHLDLNRKMDRILETFEKNEKDKETLTLRLNHVEGEVGRLKEKVAKLA